MTTQLIFGTTIWLLVAACSNVNFSSAAGKKTNSAPQVGKPSSETPASQPIPANVDPTPSVTPQPPASPKKVDLTHVLDQPNSCNISPSYDPLSILCSISTGAADTGWNNTLAWQPYTNAFKDKTANWLSPLAQIVTLEGYKFCPSVPAVEKLVFVSYVDIVEPGSYFIETLDDNVGATQLWRDTDPTKIDVNMMVIAGGNTQATLAKARYAIVIDDVDSGGAAGVAFSIQDASGNVIKNSSVDGSWCVFQMPASENTLNFVHNNAGCLPCMGRVNK